MKSSNYNRKLIKIKDKLKMFFLEYRFLFFLCLLFLIIGLSVGVYVAVKNSGIIKLDNIADNNLKDFLKGSKGTMGLLFPYIFNFCVFSGIIILVNMKPLFMWLSFCVLLVKGYLLGFNLTIIIMLYGLAGVINAIIIILPFDLICCCILLLICSLSLKRAINIKKYGCHLPNKVLNINYTKIFWLLIICGIFVVILKCLMMPLIKITIIVK